MELFEILKGIPLPILLIALLIFAVITITITYQYIKLKELNGIRIDVYKLFLKAEKKFNSGEGKQKMKYVVQRARGYLPPWLQLFITEEALTHIIELWFLGVKDLLDDGKVNGSADKPQEENKEKEAGEVYWGNEDDPNGIG